MQKLNGWQLLEQKGQRFEKALAPVFAQKEIQFIRYGSLFWFHQKTGQPMRRLEHIPAGQKEMFSKVFMSALNQGLYLAPNAYEVGFLSLAHTDEILDESVRILSAAVKGQ